MPPILFMALSLPMTQLAHFLFPAAMANGTICGSFVFCEWLLCFIMPASHIRVDVIYDTMHYAYAIFLFCQLGYAYMAAILACTTQNFHRTSGSRKSTI
jgi:hypothetical protein